MGRVDLARSGGVLQQGHPCRISTPRVRSLVVVGEFQRSSFQGGGSSRRTDNGLLKSALLEDVPCVREFGQPQAGWVRWVAVMPNIGDDMQDALRDAWHSLMRSHLQPTGGRDVRRDVTAEAAGQMLEELLT